jgi:hypothetical protein
MPGARQRQRLDLVLVACVALLTGCVTRGPVDDPGLLAKLGFLQPGGPTRTEVEARLGPPEHTYESGRIATYAVGEREGHLTTDLPRNSTTYTLVIEYAPDGTIARRSLVQR